MALLAKLSRPRLAGIYPRERLFARLDECRRHAAVWICGPPGAGKTTLTASYLDARSLPALWYQVDSGDADPASFFYYLGMGARHAGLSRKTHLPLLTPEYMPDLAGFTRRYFRALCAGLPHPCVLVLDNAQEAPDTSSGAVLLAALTEIPAGINVLILSRAEPTPELARLRASQILTELGWDELRLTEEEATHIAANARRTPMTGVGELVDRCDGWAAGLTLLLDHARAKGEVAETPESRQALFDYFAAELFDRLPPQTQHLLLRTALLPWVNVVMAHALSGNDNAGAVLEALRRKRLFTERRAGATASYQYHALFREFLKDRLEATVNRGERRQLAHKSAQWLARADDTDAALRLYLAADDQGAAAQLVLAHAPALAAQGRLQTLAAWISALQAGTVKAVPWLAYWFGICQLGTDPPAGRVHLEAAFDRFGEARDTLGQAVAAAGIIETHNIEFRNFTLLDPWIEHLHRLLDREPTFPDPALELSVVGSLLGALVMRRPERELLEPYAARARLLLDVVPDTNSRVAGAIRLLHYYSFLANAAAADHLIAYSRHHLSDPQLLPHLHCMWLHFESFWCQMGSFDERRANDAVDKALELMERYGLQHFAVLLRARAAQFRLEVGDVERAAWHLAQAVPPLEGRNDMAWHNGIQSWVALLRGDHQAAVIHAQVLVHECAKAGMPHGYRMSLLLLANALAGAGDRSGALECVRQARAAHVNHYPLDQTSTDFIEADLHLASGDAAEAQALLQGAFALARQKRLFNTLQWLAPQMSRLCAFAMEHGIETEFVSELVRARGLLPPSPDTQIWPWPIKVHTLSRFEILKDDEPLRFEGKTQRKPLALLKALIALGSADVPEDKLIDIVWAETLEGDEQKAFDVNVHRLRKLLGNDRAIQVTDRRVSLNREIVWVDLWALERKLAAVVPIANAGVPDAEPLERAAPAILNLYRGHFLDGDGDAPWLLPVRNRLSGRFQRFVMRLGDHWETAGDWGRAAELYERAVELDALAETFYCRQMVCLREQGRRVEAIEVFRRCRQMLSVTLGVKPTEATEAVYRRLIGS